ncbi:MAG TPA: tetratricopeptide repeat protein [Vicinamibacterales bacterium]|nr:tetratricopeptide repeat protein [Vicinamibacterales bacterium]
MHRELVLLIVLIGVTVAAFVATRAVALSNKALHHRQAAAWFDEAQRASRSGNAETAIAGFRRAVSRAPENRQYRLELAEELAVGGLYDEAKRVLLALREAEPEDPDTNVQLARLEALGADADATRRYYQNALAGLWRPEQAAERRRLRIELIEFLLAHDERARALSELLLLAANLPQEAALQAQVGQMFLAAGDPRLALDHSVLAIRLDPENADALAGAGEAAFELGDYNRALRYLKTVPRENTHAAELRELAQLILSGDPLVPRLGANERRRRLSAAFQRAADRLDLCLSEPSAHASASLLRLQREAEDFTSVLEGSRRREPRDLADEGVDLVYRIERAVEQSCETPPAPFDRALLLIGRRHGFEQS